ncbi:MAG: sodium:solute symporter [Blastocatellales bacterium]|nr:sodium:solute symporter [Blastocatellales bacterium]
MRALDLTILVAYLIGTVVFGAWFSRSQKNVRDYFVSGHRVPWWAIAGSIVATETSTVTFISVPGFAYNANFTFMQLVIGYMIGRIVVVWIFVPLYFRGELLTVYQLLGTRFGSGVRRLASLLFLGTRSLADGFRLFATGLVLAALLLAMPGAEDAARALFPSITPTFTILIISVLVMGAATILYTYLGGITAVIWTDVIQLTVYLIGALIAGWVLLDRIPGGWSEVLEVGGSAGKFAWFDFTASLTKSYTFWSGVIGGAFLTTATHGTDQLMVQRYLCSASTRQARTALLVSGVVVFFQFMLFLGIGAMLYVYYTGHAPSEIAAFTVNGRLQTDRIFPHFIVAHLPSGVVGLVMAAIFSAAMSTLSSSLNSSAATAVGDFYMPMTRNNRSDAHYLNVSRLMTAVWGAVQIGVAIAAINLSSRVVDEVLGIASFTNGVILGLFFLGTFTKRAGQRAAFVGIIVGASVMLAIKLGTAVSWQWYVLIGSLTTFASGYAASLAVGDHVYDDNTEKR